MITETGLPRAQRRAAAKGLTVGAPVRAFIGQGRPRPNGNGHPGRRTDNVGPGGAQPLDVAARLFNYQTQVSVRGHALVGTNWRPTPRQFRRIVKNVSSRATREMLRADRDRSRPRYFAPDPYPVTPESERLAEFWAQKRDDSVTPSHEVVTNLATGEQRAEAVRELIELGHIVHPDSPAAPRGFRVVDRRGEHW